MRRTNAPTLSDVARDAGVSAMVASVVLNGAKSSTRVSEKTRSRVVQAAERLGYRPNEAARGLIRRRMDAIGVVAVVDHGEDLNLYFLAVLNGVLEAALENKQNITVFSIEDWHRDEARILHSCDGRIDGMILIGPSLSDELGKECVKHTPFVTIHGNHVIPGIPDMDVDNASGACTLVQYLIAHGHRRILHLTGPLHIADAAKRLAGYRRALEEAQIPFEEALVVPGDYNVQSGRQGMKAYLEAQGDAPLPTAVFCASDAIAYGCMETLAEHGLRVPEDISVVGFDDTLTARMTNPPLTTMRQPFREMGRRAVERLLLPIRGDEIENGESEPPPYASTLEIFPVTLIVRASVAPPAPYIELIK